MAEHSYPPPVDKLLTYGDARNFGDQWPNYLALGLTTDHTPELVRMATDPALNKAHSESLEVWAPIHALRALGQLHDETAIEPLIPLLDEVDDDDALFEELPDVFAAFGPVAISALSAYLDNLTHTSFARVVTAGSALAQVPIGRRLA